jgi:hypothetical protein
MGNVKNLKKDAHHKTKPMKLQKASKKRVAIQSRGTSTRAIRKKLVPLAAVFLFATAATILITLSKAATPYASLEPETATVTSPAKVVTDATTSNGKYLEFGTGAGSPPPTGGTRTCTGFPDASCTGTIPGTTLTPRQGDLEITQANTVVQNLDVNGTIWVMAPGVTIRNVKAKSINTGGNRWPFVTYSPGTLIEDVEIDGKNNTPMGIDGHNFTARRVNIYGTKNGFRIFTNTTIEYSYMHDFYTEPGDHQSGIGSNGGSNFVIRGNNIECGTISGCSANLVLYGDFSQIDNVLVENNLFNGGIMGTHAGSVAGKPYPLATNVRYLNNQFGRKYYPNCGYYGPVASWNGSGAGNQWSGNVYQGTNTPVQ